MRAGAFNAFDQLTATTVTGVGAGAGSYTYDSLGRSTSVPAIDVPGPTKTADVALTYYANDLVASQTQGTTSRTYNLDALGRLASWVDTSTGTTTTTTNHYDGAGDSAAWTDTSTGTWTRQVTSPAGVLGLTATGTTGSGVASGAVMDLVNPHGDVIATIPDTAGVTSGLSGLSDTDEYGNTLSGPSTTYGWIGGKGRITDTASGLVQMGVRLYNSATGLFASVDSVYGGNATGYAYPNDPVSGYDLSGRWGPSWLNSVSSGVGSWLAKSAAGQAGKWATRLAGGLKWSWQTYVYAQGELAGVELTLAKKTWKWGVRASGAGAFASELAGDVATGRYSWGKRLARAAVSGAIAMGWDLAAAPLAEAPPAAVGVAVGGNFLTHKAVGAACGRWIGYDF